MKKANGQGGRSFDSVPADDGFRNYMARKIELQRKQFGLVLPPPPDLPQRESSPDNHGDASKQAAGCVSSEQLESSTRSSLSDSSSRKSVRFHSNLEQVAPITSVSDILENLKQKHSVRKSSLRRRRYGVAKKSKESFDFSMDGVLDKLQRKHGVSSKRKRPVSSFGDKQAAATAADDSLTQSDSSSLLIDSNVHDTYNNLQMSGSLKSQNECDNADDASNANPVGSHITLNSGQQSTSSEQFIHTHNQFDVHYDYTSKRQKNSRSDLFFTGVVVLINGHTNPDATTLMRLLHKHGGDLEKYETRRVTHIIAERLSTAKANIYKNQKRPTPVCRPEWITNSVKQGKLLPFADYLLDDVMETKTPGTMSLKTFFEPEKETQQQETSETHRLADTDQSKSNYHINGQVRTIGNDPNFLESYFSSSRLSYIGSFKQRVKTTEGAIISQKPKAGSKRFVLLVDIDCFFAAVALKNFPEYKNCPVAVGHSPTVNLESTDSSHSKATSPSNKAVNNSSSELSTCNYIARKFGVRKGMFLGDAIKLCPKLVVLPYDFTQYESISGLIADMLHQYAEQFDGSVEQVSCDECYMEIHITQQDHKGQFLDEFLKSLAEQIRKDIFDATECTVSIGVSRNKFLAKLAADKVKPDASEVVKDYRELLDGLALRDLHGVGRRIEKKLIINGLHTVNDVWDLREDAERVLSEIAGAAVSRKIVNFCYGKDERQLTPQIRKTIGAECNYGVRFDGPFGPDYMLNGLSKELEKRMTSIAVRGSKLILKLMKSKEPKKMPRKFLGHGLCEHLSKSMDIPLTRNCDVIFAYSLKLFQKLAVDKEEIRGMGLVVSSLESDSTLSHQTSPSKLDTWLKTAPTKPPAETMSSFNMCLTAQNNTTSTMPTYSQLDQDVLTELPDDILKEVQITYGKKPTDSATKIAQSLFSSPKSKQLKPENPIAIPGQASVKRMLKLASVKAGEDELPCANGEFTLSQLDCLPLETQLQIANNDDIRISMPEAPCQRSSLVSRTQRANRIEGRSVDSEEEDNNDCHTTACDMFHKSKDFYNNNIVPLQEFVRSKPHPHNDDVSSVIDFLFACVGEGRCGDTVVFLRVIKNMQRGWGASIYDQIKEAVVDEIQRLKGCALDTAWLGL